MENSTFKIQLSLLFFYAVITSMMLLSCSHSHSHEQKENEPEALTYTIYTDKTELFVEFSPLIAGRECHFAAHFTELGERFTAFTEGSIKLTLDVNGIQTAVTANEPQTPGIFRLHVTPNTTGMGKLIFDIQTKSFTDQIIIDSVQVYPDEKTALENPIEKSENNDITYLKEQAWKVEFANAPVKKQAFSYIIKTNGQILSAPGDERIIIAKASGIVLFTGNKTIIGSEVKAGTNLFTIAGGDLTEDNIDANFKETKANYEKAKLDFERSSELVKDQIISQKEFLDVKLKYENARNDFNTISKNYSAKGQTVSSAMGGYLKNILITEGQFVSAGTPLATISQNKKLILQANVSQKYFDKLPSITSANFRTTGSETVLSTTQLNGKIITYGKSVTVNSPFIPLIFEINNAGNLIPGSVADVYLKSYPIAGALIIPVTALIEEQGSFFVYVQTGGESFQKREVKLGGNDGINVQLLSGVTEGERVVTKGAYQIKLSTASGTMPAHGHEH